MSEKRHEAERLFPTSPPPGRTISRRRDKKIEWMRNQLELYGLAFKGIVEGIVIVLPDGIVTHFNPAAAQMFGLVDDDVETHNMFNTLFAVTQGGNGKQLERQFLASGRIERGRTAIENASGKLTRLEVTLVPMERDGVIARFVITCRDVTLEEEQRRELEDCAVTDLMTGFLNRRGFAAVLEQLGRTPVCVNDLPVLFIDLDDFGWVNKQHQMKAGDRIICEAAQLIRGCIRKTDHAIRFGGDEFVLILEGADMRSAMRVAQDILETLRQTSFPIEGTTETCQVTASIGIACMHRAKYTMSHFIVNAEYAKHEAKKLGKNQIWVYNRDLIGK